jgi:AcrR family transcriptional regulator
MATRAMRRNTVTELRKAPRQSRSGATFGAIVEAAARILAERGPRALTTNQIARRAGVSVGSLYQYFPNKLAVVRALLEREVERAEALRPAVLDDAATPLAQRLRAAVDWHCAALAADPALAGALRALADRALPAAQRAELVSLRTGRTRRTVASVIPAGRDLDHAAFVVEVCLDALTSSALARHPEWLSLDSFRAEVAQLLDGYLAEVQSPS